MPLCSSLMPEGATVLVTGANGFIASHVIDQLLDNGFKVRGTVRSESKVMALKKHFNIRYGRDSFQPIIVPDIAAEGAFEEAVKHVSGIVHLASAATFTSQSELAIPQTIAGALNLFISASKQPGIKSIVYTSDSFAALFPEPNKVINVTSTTYNETAVAAATDPSSADCIRKEAWDPTIAYELNVYAAAKVAAEKAIWRYVESHNLPFHVSSILPNVNIGSPVGGLLHTSTGTFVPDLLKGKANGLMFPAQYYVNVRDCAQLHVAALLDPTQDRKRIFAMAGPFNWNDVLDILRKLRPHLDIMDDMPDLGQDLSIVPNREAEELLRKHFRHGWTSLDESVEQNLENV